MEFANRLNRERRAPGLRKFRSYEEAKQSHDRATRQRKAALSDKPERG